MSVKVSLSKEVVKGSSFPKLMTNDRGMIVLFYEERKGMVLRVVDVHKIGVYSESWGMEHFQDYEGEITLKNE
jgi:hypothetical protein